MAILETGLSWATPSGDVEHRGSRAASSASNPVAAAEHSPGTDIAVGAPEHTNKRFIEWILRVVKAIERHKKDPTVEEQRRISGTTKYTSGLTEHEKNLRAARTEARSNFNSGAKLFRRLRLYNGKGKSKGKGQHDDRQTPLAWDDMSGNQKWYVEEYRNGNLLTAKETAEQQYAPRSADTTTFRMD